MQRRWRVPASALVAVGPQLVERRILASALVVVGPQLEWPTSWLLALALVVAEGPRLVARRILVSTLVVVRAQLAVWPVQWLATSALVAVHLAVWLGRADLQYCRSPQYLCDKLPESCG